MNAVVPDMNNGTVNGTAPVKWNERDLFTPALVKNLIVTILCISINYINATLVHTFRKHQIFNTNTRYILFIHLVVNDMMQLFLSTLLHVISYTLHVISVPFCLILMVTTVLTTLNTPLNLGSMAVECYIAICFPLRYGQLCTVRKTYVLMGLIWLVSAASVLPDIIILILTEPLQFFHSRIFCVREYVFRSVYSMKKRDISHIIFLVLVWLTLFFTYFKIIFTAKGASMHKDAQIDLRKTRNTILLHGFQLLLCMLTYIRPMFEDALMYFFNERDILFGSYVIIQILPRFISPIVYGLRDQTFRRYMRRYLLCTMNLSKNATDVTMKISKCGVKNH